MSQANGKPMHRQKVKNSKGYFKLLRENRQVFVNKTILLHIYNTFIDTKKGLVQYCMQ